MDFLKNILELNSQQNGQQYPMQRLPGTEEQALPEIPKPVQSMLKKSGVTPQEAMANLQNRNGAPAPVQQQDAFNLQMQENQKMQEYLASQKAGIGTLEDQYKALPGQQSMNPIVGILAAASDTLGSSQTKMLPQLLQQQATANTTLDDKKMKYLDKIQGARSDYSKENIAYLGKQIAEKKADQNLANQDLKDKILLSRLNNSQGNQNTKLEGSIFNEWQKNTITKNSQDVATAYEKVNSAAKDATGASDLSLIFGYMKMLDPGSTVREGEFATAQNATGIPDRILNSYNNAIKGTRLNPTQRLDFSGQAQKVLKAQLEQQKRWDKTMSERARNSGIDPERVIHGKTLFGDAYTNETQGIKPGAIEDGHVFLGGDPKAASSWKEVGQ